MNLLALLERLRAESQAQGGNLITLNGNHELMNVAGDFRYVTPDGFADYAKSDASWLRSCAQPTATQARARAFAPGGKVARQLATRPVVAIVRDTVFVHGGLLPQHVSYGLEQINREQSAWMLGGGAPLPAGLMAEDSPVWSRRYSDGTPSEQDCITLTETLQRIGVRRMVVGHTVQPAGITSACGEHVWRIDVGMTRAFGGRPEALEIGTDSKIRILRD
jgi:hypothetical protein